MGCCSSKRKSKSYDDNFHVLQNGDPYDENVYTLNLLKCYPKQPTTRFPNEPYYYPVNRPTDSYQKLNFNNSYNCGCIKTGYERLDSINPIENLSTDVEAEETDYGTPISKPIKQYYYPKRYNTNYPKQELSAVSYECRSSESFLSYTCKCFHSKTPKDYQIQDNDYKELYGIKNVGTQMEAEKCCNVREEYDKYIKKMENSWYCCYNLLHEIKDLLSCMEGCDDKGFTRLSPIIDEKMKALPDKFPEGSELVKKEIGETDGED